MKNQIISLLGLATLIFLSGCTFVETPEPTTLTTRTTTAEVSPTVYGTVETKTTQTY